MSGQDIRSLCRLFATVVDYPGSTLRQSASDCARLLEQIQPSASESMRDFVELSGRLSPGEMEELYAQTFDITPETTLYLGYYLFGETAKRSSFMVRLQEAYKSCDFSSPGELTDHLSVLLRFLSVTTDAEFARTLIDECMLSSLQQVEKPLQKNKNGYAPAIAATRLFLQQASRTMMKTGGLQHA